MISFDQTTGIQTVNLNSEGFGGSGGRSSYIEGPWFYRRGDIYYLSYPGARFVNGGFHEALVYSTSSTPTGPWKYQGLIMTGDTPGSAFTNQDGIFDFKGHSYIFYHNQDLPGGSGYDRSVCLEEFKYNADGTIPAIPPTKEGPAPLGHLDPFQETKAATFAWESGIHTTEITEKSGVYVTDIADGSYIKVKSVDFGKKGAKSFEAKVASGAAGGTIEIHLDSQSGELAGSISVPNTGDGEQWKTEKAKITGVKDVHDIYFVFKGNPGDKLFNFSSWKFSK
jgi:hypothetical protein